MRLVDVNILNLDTEIKRKFAKKQTKISKYQMRINQIDKLLEESLKLSNSITKDLIATRKQLVENIEEIRNNVEYNFYLSQSSALIAAYKKILETPIKLNFMGKSSRKINNKKKEVVYAYLKIAKKYITLDFDIDAPKQPIIQCQNCSSKDLDIIDGTIHICLECSAQSEILAYSSSYKDIDRVNISNKYVYDRKIHFRDCLNQYQGKQNSTILKKVYDDLIREFELHHLLVGKEGTPKKIRFKNITKDHISLFLKELGHTKHYENVNLIHYNITGKKPDDISYLEDSLLNDFDTLTQLYDKRFKDIERKSFINTQYVLYQLLRRYKHPCKKEDFTILKTVDRKAFHDDVCKILFEELGWNYIPYF